MRIKRFLPAALLVGALMLQACGAEDSSGGTGSRTGSGPSTVNDVLTENMAKEDEKAAEAPADEASVEISEEIVPAAAEAVEEVSAEAAEQTITATEESSVTEENASAIEGDYVDLTALSSTMIYSEVYNMMYYPENYVGKVIRMEGAYSDYYDEAKGKHFYGCIIMDATACCAQGVEFEPTADFTYPDDFPKEGDMILVEGTFDLYEEEGYTYCTLRNATMEKR